jgi:hypothetical protein
MRRRVVCPRSHPASPFARVLSVRFAMARGIFRGIPPGPPMSPLCSPVAPPLAPHPRARCALPMAPSLARCGSGWWRLRVALPPTGPPSSAAPGGAPSWDAAGAAEGVFAGRCGLGAASSLRMRLWRRIFASEPVVAPHLRFSLCRGAQARLHTPAAPGSPIMPAHPGGAAATSRPPVVHFAHTRDAPSTARGDFPAQGLPSVARKAIQAHLHVHCSRPGCEP